MIKNSKKKEAKLLEGLALFNVIKARLNGFSPFLQAVSVVV